VYIMEIDTTPQLVSNVYAKLKENTVKYRDVVDTLTPRYTRNMSLENGDKKKPNDRQDMEVSLGTGGKILLKICCSNGQ
jgi:hypothetical protein